MDRRGFLKLLGLGAAAVVGHELDVDRLLWVPGRKTIFIPTPREPEFVFVMQDVPLDQYLARYLEPAVKAMMDDIDRRALFAFQAEYNARLNAVNDLVFGSGQLWTSKGRVA